MSSAIYRKLLVWQKSMDLVEDVYRITKKLPKDELYGLISQLRRSVVSIPSNIAEGNSRQTKKEYIQFLHIARGSKAEVETQLEICVRLKYIELKEINKAISLCDEIGRILNTLIRKQSIIN
jgi:four helix bundle protein